MDALRPLSFLLILLSAVPAFSQSNPPTSEQRASAKQHFDNGQRKFDVGRFDDAAAEFEIAYELSGLPEILFNMAQAYRNARRYEKALVTYRSFLQRVPETPNRPEVERRIDELQGLIKQQHEEEARKADEARRQQLLHEQQQQQQQQAAENAQAQPQAPHATPPKPLPRWVRWAGVGGAAVGVAGIGVGVAMSVLAGSEANTVQTAAGNHAVFDSSLHDAESRGHTYDTASIACYAVGGALAAAGAVLIIISARQSGPRESARLYVTPAPGALVLGGKF